jgi:release factor glutamine methyltransferase
MVLLYNYNIYFHENVYEPSEDTFLFIDTILKNTSLFKNKTILEMGCGSGIISIILSKFAKEINCVDINQDAIELTKQNVKNNNIKNIKIKYSNLFSNIKNKYDIIIFNTPYLPQNNEETIESALNYAWDGGLSGRDIIDKFLKDAPNYLTTNGEIIELESSLSNYEKSITFLKEQNFEVNILSELKLCFEKLVVIRAIKQKK